MAAPLISVVMPVHNGERFVGQAVESILAQTMGDFEFIVVDDGSTDDTPVILAGLAERDRRLQVLRNERNLGVNAARNRGCARACAEFLAVMDADDVSLAPRFERQLAYLRRHSDVAALGTWVRRFDAEGRLGAVHAYPTSSALVAWSMHFYNSLAHPTVMMRRAMLPDGPVYDPSFPVAEDYALLFRLSRRRPVANLEDVLLHYRTWPGNTTKNSPIDVLANKVVRTVLADEEMTVSESDVETLQGLSRDRYPHGQQALLETSRLIERLADHHAQTLRLSETAKREVDREAGARLWLLSALAAKSSPLTAARLAATASRRSTASLLDVSRKVVRRLTGA